MPKILEKVERRLGKKLFLKGDRCGGPKCAGIRRAYPPGAHGKAHRRGGSEFRELLAEKQTVRFLYGLDDKDVRRYAQKAASQPGIFSFHFTRLLEMRLDNIVFRLGLAPSRRSARQVVLHGHVMVNGKTMWTPSAQIKKGDTVSVREPSRSLPVFSGRAEQLKKHAPPQWLKLDPVAMTGTVEGLPNAEDTGVFLDVTKVKEFYSR